MLHVHLLRGYGSEVLVLVTAVLPELDPPHHLLVDQLGGDQVLGGGVPWGEYLFPEEESPGGIALLCTLFLGVLLALGNGVHHVVPSRPQRGDLVEERDVEGEAEPVLQSDLLAQLGAQLLRSGGRVREESLGGPIHEGDGQHQRLLALGSLGEGEGEGVIGACSTKYGEGICIGTCNSSQEGGWLRDPLRIVLFSLSLQ